MDSSVSEIKNRIWFNICFIFALDVVQMVLILWITFHTYNLCNEINTLGNDNEMLSSKLKKCQTDFKSFNDTIKTIQNEFIPECLPPSPYLPDPNYSCDIPPINVPCISEEDLQESFPWIFNTLINGIPLIDTCKVVDKLLEDSCKEDLLEALSWINTLINGNPLIDACKIIHSLLDVNICSE